MNLPILTPMVMNPMANRAPRPNFSLLVCNMRFTTIGKG
jgi:hypothetical protein